MDFPNLVLERVAEYLTPKEVSYLASCDRRLREVLPVRPLRICICIHGDVGQEREGRDRTRRPSRSSSLHDGEPFFVTEEPSGRLVRDDERLRFGGDDDGTTQTVVRYRFWLYDDKRKQRVDLKRHVSREQPAPADEAAAEGGGGGEEVFGGHDICLMVAEHRPKLKMHRNQDWTILDGNTTTPAAAKTTGEERDREFVPWGHPVGLVVRGASQSSLIDEKYASAPSPGLLTVLGENKWRALPTGERPDVILPNQRLTLHRYTDVRRRGGGGRLQDGTRNVLQIRAQHEFVMSQLPSYYIFSQRSLRSGTIRYTGMDSTAVVELEIWIEKRHLFVCNEEVLRGFKLVIPISAWRESLERESFEDEPLMEELFNNLDGPFHNLTLRYYIATVADKQKSPEWTVDENFYSIDKGKKDEENNSFVLNLPPGREIDELVKDIPRDRSRKFYAVIAQAS